MELHLVTGAEDAMLVQGASLGKVLEGQVSSLVGGVEPNQSLQGLEHQAGGFASLPQFPRQKGEEVTWKVATSRFLG